MADHIADTVAAVAALVCDDADADGVAVLDVPVPDSKLVTASGRTCVQSVS
jgi:hypothetical protein